jgi:hypothetical protein
MSDEQFHQHAEYPRHYQSKEDDEDVERVEGESKTTARDASRKLPPACLLISQIETLIELCSQGI